MTKLLLEDENDEAPFLGNLGEIIPPIKFPPETRSNGVSETEPSTCTTRNSLVVSFETKNLRLRSHTRDPTKKTVSISDLEVVEVEANVNGSAKKFRGKPIGNFLAQLNSKKRGRPGRKKLKRGRPKSINRRHTESFADILNDDYDDSNEYARSEPGSSRKVSKQERNEDEAESAANSEKPREERPYTEYFPDLDPDKPLQIVRRPTDFYVDDNGVSAVASASSSTIIDEERILPGF
jgi:hypothetical protein